MFYIVVLTVNLRNSWCFTYIQPYISTTQSRVTNKTDYSLLQYCAKLILRVKVSRLSNKMQSIKLARNLTSPETIFGSISILFIFFCCCLFCCVYCFPWGYCRYRGPSFFISLLELVFILSQLCWLLAYSSFQCNSHFSCTCVKNNGSLGWSHEISRHMQITRSVPVI